MRHLSASGLMAYRAKVTGDHSRSGTKCRRPAPAALANNVIQLRGSGAKRLRIAGFRVLFTETDTTITVLDVGPRGEIYE